MALGRRKKNEPHETLKAPAEQEPPHGEEPEEETAPAEEEAVVAEEPAEEVAVVAEEPAEEVAVIAEEPAEEVAVVAEEPTEEVAVVAEEPAEEEAVVAEEPAEEVAVVAEEPAEEVVIVAEEPAEEVAVVAEEPAEESAEEPEDEEDEEEAEEEEVAVLPLPDKNFVRGRYNKSFTAKLLQSSDLIKQYYADLYNEFCAYEKVRNRVSWANSAFYIGRRTVSKFSIRGKTLYLYLALDPNDFLDSKYFVTDESAVRRYETVPLRMKVKSGRGVKFGKELIGILMQKCGVTRAEGRVGTATASDYPYDTTGNLLERGLIKLNTEGGQAPTDRDCVVWAEFEKREQVSVAEAQDLISDEAAVSCIEEEEEPEETVLPRPKGIINIDTLSKNYQPYDTVTLGSLKEKKLIAASVNYVKVLARGVLNKPLTVKMPEFSVDAVKMILLTGGKVIKLKTKKK